MASFSSGGGVGNINSDDAGTGGEKSLFVGTFNMNSEGLSMQAARAWLKQAADADMVALGLQECGVVPANPFPEPTNGMAVARWQTAKDLATALSSNAEKNANGGECNPRKSLAPNLADIAQAAITAALKRKISDGERSSEASASPGLDDSVDSVEGSRRALFAARPESDGSKGMRQESYYLRGVVEAERDEELLSTITQCIPGRHIVADVAMGETPTHGKIKVTLSPTKATGPSAGEAFAGSPDSREEGSDADAGDGPGDDGRRKEGCPLREVKSEVEQHESFKSVEWYGTIRLLVFVRSEVFRELSVRTVVIPSGDKPSVVCDAPEDYAKDTSPDKGAVACFLKDPSTQTELLLVNCHLYGTNKYGVCEAVFDQHRMTQLRAINVALKATLPSTATDKMVLLGDLNFRVEKMSEAKDKARGGNDFQEVHKIAKAGDPRGLLKLYREADRLRLMLEGRQGENEASVSPGADGEREPQQGSTASTVQMPALLERLRDGLGAALERGAAVRPTFTFKPKDTSATPRRYNDKRTPSWPDRILWRGFVDQEHVPHEFAAVPDVISSDHEPVYCLLTL